MNLPDRFYAPPLTPEGLYSQDKKRREWDERERAFLRERERREIGRETIRRGEKRYYLVAITSDKRYHPSCQELIDELTSMMGRKTYAASAPSYEEYLARTRFKVEVSNS